MEIKILISNNKLRQLDQVLQSSWHVGAFTFNSNKQINEKITTTNHFKPPRLYVACWIRGWEKSIPKVVYWEQGITGK